MCVLKIIKITHENNFSKNYIYVVKIYGFKYPYVCINDYVYLSYCI